MSCYTYSPLFPGSNSIRLLRLLPHEDSVAPIQCQLFNYSLQRSSKGSHLYEALSYVWGDPKKSLPIFISERRLDVTVNLHAALLRLRDPFLERIVWVDAICINQHDLQERCRQVRAMAKIYGYANRVVIWLGEESDDSDRAFAEIGVAAGESSASHSRDGMMQKGIFDLLQRPWFRRIWVLQEVAAARRVLMMCGSAEMNGYVFCLGLQSLKLSYEEYPNLEALIRSLTYLIRGAILRPKFSGKAYLDIRPIGELVDMFHAHEATLRLDKVYALLGMSTESPSAAALLPDYNISWRELFQRLIKLLLSDQVVVDTWEDKETAVIKSKGCILGQVTSVERDIAWEDQQNVHVTSKSTSMYLEYDMKWSAHWALQSSAKTIRQGDLVCLLEGAQKPSIIRMCKDHIIILMITASGEYISTSGENITWPDFWNSIKNFPCDFVLTWDWSQSPGDQPAEALAETSIRAIECPETQSESHLDQAKFLLNTALILEHSEEYEEAERRLGEVVKIFESMFGIEHSHTLSTMSKLAIIYKKRGHWKRGKKLFVDVICARKRMQGKNDPDTMSNMADLLSIYKGCNDRRDDDMELLSYLLKRIMGDAKITERMVVQIAKIFDKEVMRLLLELRGNEVQITEVVIKAAARNWRGGTGIMLFLSERLQDDLQITQGVIEEAASCAFGTLSILLNRKGNDIQITEAVVERAAKNWSDTGVMEYLLKLKGKDLPITQRVVEAAAMNQGIGQRVMSLLLQQRGADVKITGEVARAAATNQRCGQQVLELLLKERPQEMNIANIIQNTDIVKVAATHGQESVLEILQRYHEIDDWTTWLKVAEFYTAAENGQVDTIQRLLLEGVDPDLKNASGTTPLWIATVMRHSAVVKVLLGSGAVDVNFPDNYRHTPLYYAAACNCTEIFRLLLSHGASPSLDYEDMEGTTPRLIAQEYNRTEMLKILNNSLVLI